MVRNGLYILIASLMLVSCEDSSGNIDSSGSSSYSNLVRQVSSTTATSYDDDALNRIEEKCGSENEGSVILIGDDGDMNGVLEYSEALATGSASILCNGKDGQIVANTTDIFDDEIFRECGNSNGLAFSVAYDSDNNGELTENEVTANNYRIICETQNAMFEIEHFTYYSTLSISSGQTDTKVNFYYPKITEIPVSSTDACAGTGGVRVEMLSPEDSEDSGQPVLDVNQTICNGADGETPIISSIDANSSQLSNSECKITGGIKVSLLGQNTFICNGEKGSFDSDLNLSIAKDSLGNVYIYNGTERISQPLDITILQINDNVAPLQTIVTKQDSTVTCPYGELNVSTFTDLNYNYAFDSATETISQSEIVCSAEPKSAEALTVLASMRDTNLVIDFEFSRAVNPLTVDANTVIFMCEQEYISGEIDYTMDIDSDGVQNFTFTYLQTDLPQPSTDIDCTFKVSKFVEDTDGISMQESYTKEFNALTVN